MGNQSINTYNIAHAEVTPIFLVALLLIRNVQQLKKRLKGCEEENQMSSYVGRDIG